MISVNEYKERVKIFNGYANPPNSLKLYKTEKLIDSHYKNLSEEDIINVPFGSSFNLLLESTKLVVFTSQPPITPELALISPWEFTENPLDDITKLDLFWPVPLQNHLSQK